MSLLAKFLAAKEPLFRHSLLQLEELTDKQGIDAALTAEMATKVAHAGRDLGIDPQASGPELYAALIKRVQTDDERLARALGGQNPTALHEMVPLIVKRLAAIDLPKRGYFLKLESACKFLLQEPPRQIMRRLGYADVKKMVAAENPNELFCALRFAETADWLNQFNTLYAELKPADFEERDIQLIVFDEAKWGDIAQDFVKKKLHNITHSKELGVICVMPTGAVNLPGVTIKVLPLIVHYFNEIRLYSAFFKLMQAKSNFGQIVAQTLIADTPEVPILAGQTIHWRVIQRYFGKLKDEPHPELFEPHLQPEDLHWRRAEDILYEVDPQLEFWQGLDFVGAMIAGDTVSFNLMDVSLSYSNQLAYPDRYIYHFRESLWNEIFARYFSHKVLEQQLLTKLNNQLIAPESLPVTARRPGGTS
jgi:hypothetical protein